MFTVHFGGMLVLLILRVCLGLLCFLIITAISTNRMLNFVCLHILNQYLVISHWFSAYIPNILFLHTVLTQNADISACPTQADCTNAEAQVIFPTFTHPTHPMSPFTPSSLAPPFLPFLLPLKK